VPSSQALDKLASAAAQRSNEQALLVETNAILAAVSEPEAAFAHVLSRLKERAGLAYAAIYRLFADGGLLECIAQSGQREPDCEVGLSVNLAALSNGTDQTAALAQVGGARASLPVPDLERGELARYVVPLRRDSRLLGLLEVSAGLGGS